MTEEKDDGLLPPSVDPKKRAIGIRKVSAVNEASTRSVMTVRPFFNWVNFTIRVKTSETPERFAKLAKNVGFRCPVMNLFRSSGVEFSADWQFLDVTKSQNYAVNTSKNSNKDTFSHKLLS